MRDPLLILSLLIGAAILAVIVRYATTGQVDTAILTFLSAALGILVPALTKQKGSDDDDPEP